MRGGESVGGDAASGSRSSLMPWRDGGRTGARRSTRTVNEDGHRGRRIAAAS